MIEQCPECFSNRIGRRFTCGSYFKGNCLIQSDVCKEKLNSQVRSVRKQAIDFVQQTINDMDPAERERLMEKHREVNDVV